MEDPDTIKQTLKNAVSLFSMFSTISPQSLNEQESADVVELLKQVGNQVAEIKMRLVKRNVLLQSKRRRSSISLGDVEKLQLDVFLVEGAGQPRRSSIGRARKSLMEDLGDSPMNSLRGSPTNNFQTQPQLLSAPKPMPTPTPTPTIPTPTIPTPLKNANGNGFSMAGPPRMTAPTTTTTTTTTTTKSNFTTKSKSTSAKIYAVSDDADPQNSLTSHKSNSPNSTPIGRPTKRVLGGGSQSPLSPRQRQPKSFDVGLSPAKLASMTEEEISTYKNLKLAKEAFNLIDINGDGFLQKTEVLLALKKMAKSGASVIPAKMEIVEKMMAEVDTDGDGQIDLDEFVSMMKNGQRLGVQVGS